MTRHEQCTVWVRLIGILIAGLTFADAWHAAHAMVINRFWFVQYIAWLWPLSNYDEEALDDLGTLIQFGLALVMVLRARWVARLVMWRMRPEGECPKCGYDVRGGDGEVSGVWGGFERALSRGGLTEVPGADRRRGLARPGSPVRSVHFAPWLRPFCLILVVRRGIRGFARFAAIRA